MTESRIDRALRLEKRYWRNQQNEVLMARKLHQDVYSHMYLAECLAAEAALNRLKKRLEAGK